MKPWACCNEYAGDGEVVEFPVDVQDLVVCVLDENITQRQRSVPRFSSEVEGGMRMRLSKTPRMRLAMGRITCN